MRKIKILSKIHLYLSLPVGLIISVICLTGTVMVLYKDIHKLLNTELYKVKEVKASPLPMDELVSNLLLQYPIGKEVTDVQIFADQSSTYQFDIEGERGVFFVNQYTGEFLGQYDSFKKGGVYRTMFYMHRWLMHYDRDLPIGKTLVGVSTILLVFILLTGFFIWLPRGVYALKKALSIHVTRGWKRFWYDLHVAGGVYIGGWLLVLALTGLMWSFSWYRPMVFSLFGIEYTKRGAHKHNKKENTPLPINYITWDNALKNIKLEQDNLISITLKNGEASVYNQRYGNVRAYDTYKFNKESGAIQSFSPYASRPESSRFMGWMYAIHVGTWGGMVVKVLTFIVSLLGGVLPITGYYFWIKKEFHKRKRSTNSTIRDNR